MTMVQHTIARV